MHSFAPSAGIDLGGGVERHAEAALVEGGDGLAELRAAAVRRVLVRARVAPRRRCSASTTSCGRGRVGIADAEADHVDALRLLLGDLPLELGEQVRRDPLQAATRLSFSSFRNSSLSSPRYTGRAQPVRFTCRSSPTSTSRSPPSRWTVTGLSAAAQHGRHRGAARAGARGHRLPHPALEDPRGDLVVGVAAPERHVRAVREQLGVRLDRRAERAQVERLELRPPPRSRTAGCRSRRAGRRTRGPPT